LQHVSRAHARVAVLADWAEIVYSKFATACLAHDMPAVEAELGYERDVTAPTSRAPNFFADVRVPHEPPKSRWYSALVAHFIK